MKRIILLPSILVMGAVAAFAAAPAKPATPVSHPKTNVTVTHPRTQGVVVNRPQTVNVKVDRPVTRVTVDRPVTRVEVLRPTTPAPAVDDKSAPAPEATKVALDNSEQGTQKKGSMMSQYKAPQATDFKAAKTGGGEAGLGNKVNQAEKDAAAAAFKIPKGEAATEASVRDVSGSIGSKVSQSISNKTKK